MLCLKTNLRSPDVWYMHLKWCRSIWTEWLSNLIFSLSSLNWKDAFCLCVCTHVYMQ